MNEKEYWFWLSGLKYIHRNDIGRLLEFFGSPEEIYRASREDLLECGVLDEVQICEMTLAGKQYDITSEMKKLEHKGIRYICCTEDVFPDKLKNIPDRPYALYVKGQLPENSSPSCGIVGARACSSYGKQTAFSAGADIAAKGISIISGMALGIDAEASKGALSAGGKTFVVLGGGVDVVYPLQNMSLYYDILDNGGGIISEYPPGTEPIGWQFPQRNRLISGLSDCVIIVEARKRSGTLVTANYALEQGRDVYAVPGRITDALSYSCNRLLYDGARIFLDPADVIEDLYGAAGYNRVFNAAPAPSAAGRRRRKLKAADVTDDLRVEKGSPEEAVYRVLSERPAYLADISKVSGVGQVEASAILTGLEFKGLAEEVSADCYRRIK